MPGEWWLEGVIGHPDNHHNERLLLNAIGGTSRRKLWKIVLEVHTLCKLVLVTPEDSAEAIRSQSVGRRQKFIEIG